MKPHRKNHTKRFPRLTLGVVATGAVALAAPVADASALTFPTALPTTLPAAPPILPIPAVPLAGNAIGGNQIGSAGCVGTNRPSVGGNNGSTSHQTCGAVLAFSGPQIGEISSIIGPTVIGSPGTNVILSAGPVTAPVQVP